jgi:hypothetical protein
LLFALFNNHWGGYAPRNAVDLMKSLQLPFKELPLQVRVEKNEEPKPVDKGHVGD